MHPSQDRLQINRNGFQKFNVDTGTLQQASKCMGDKLSLKYNTP